MEQKKSTLRVTCLKDAVELTPDIQGHFCEGKNALEEGKDQITPEDNRKLSGSVNIDLVTKDLYPRENRWDYVIEYGKTLHYVEVHSAYGQGRIEEVKKKKEWLRSWLISHAPDIYKLAPVPQMYWVATGRVDLGKVNFNSPQWRKHNIPKPVKYLILK